MNRRNFVLAWGRKLFFGISWPLTSILGLVYLRSYIFPQGASEWFFFITNYIGHYGLLNALVYFLLYSPIVLIFPTYYVSRFWSIILIVGLNFVILSDGIFFASYGVHFNDFLLPLVKDIGLDFFFDASPKTLLGIVGLFILAILIWLKGERNWRQMKARFSNPIKNWYLVLILVIFGIAQTTKLMGWASGANRLSQLFPLANFLPKGPVDSSAKVNYQLPVKKLSCSAKENPNLVVIVLKEWNFSQFSQEIMPGVVHLAKHGEFYSQHFTGSNNFVGGLFSLQTSLSPYYARSITQNSFSPILVNLLSDRNYEQAVFKSDLMTGSPLEKDVKVKSQFLEWSAKRQSDALEGPYFIFITLDQHAYEADKIITEVVENLHVRHLLKNTMVVITGAYGGNSVAGDIFEAEELHVPLLVISPDRRAGRYNHPTSHYDVLPSIMTSLWTCKGAHKAMGLGKDLSTPLEWIMVSNENEIGTLDFKAGQLTTVTSQKIVDRSMSEDSSKPRRQLILDGLKELIRYRIPN